MSCWGDVTSCVLVDNCYFFISLNSVLISCRRVEVGRVGGVGRFVDIRGGVEGVEVEKIGVGVVIVIVIVIVIVVVVVIVVIVNRWMLRYWVDCCNVWDG